MSEEPVDWPFGERAGADAGLFFGIDDRTEGALNVLVARFEDELHWPKSRRATTAAPGKLASLGSRGESATDPWSGEEFAGFTDLVAATLLEFSRDHVLYYVDRNHAYLAAYARRIDLAELSEACLERTGETNAWISHDMSCGVVSVSWMPGSIRFCIFGELLMRTVQRSDLPMKRFLHQLPGSES